METEEIDIFLENLERKRQDLATRVFAQEFIGQHRSDIEAFIDKIEGRGTWGAHFRARNLRKLLTKYEQPVPGHHMNLATAQLSSTASMSAPHAPAQTRGPEKLATYAVTLALTAIVAYGGVKIYDVIKETVVPYIHQIQNVDFSR